MSIMVGSYLDAYNSNTKVAWPCLFLSYTASLCIIKQMIQWIYIIIYGATIINYRIQFDELWSENGSAQEGI